MSRRYSGYGDSTAGIWAALGVLLSMVVLPIAIWAGFWITVIWVAWHFISKFW